MAPMLSPFPERRQSLRDEDPNELQQRHLAATTTRVDNALHVQDISTEQFPWSGPHWKWSAQNDFYGGFQPPWSLCISGIRVLLATS